MRPDVSLDPAILRANVGGWRARARGAVRAVIKANGYGWGFKTLIDAIDDCIDGYYVGDTDEFAQVRPLTRRPLATLVDVAASRVGEVLDAGGIPTVSSLAAIDAANRWAHSNAKRARVRIPLRGAVGWCGIAPEDVDAFAALIAERRLDVEISDHVTDPSLQLERIAQFESALKAFRDAKVTVVATDLSSSMPAAHGVDAYSHVRIGVGLFGARFGANANVSSAIRVRAPVVEVLPARGQLVGYGLVRAPSDGYLVVVRAGYGDGFPRHTGPRGVLAVGMQYTTVHCKDDVRTAVLDLIDRDSDLDALAASARMSVHELVVGLGTGRPFNVKRRIRC